MDGKGIKQVFISHFQKILAPKLKEINPSLESIEPFGCLFVKDGFQLNRPIIKSRD